MVAAERAHELSIHVDRRDRRLERSRQRDADIGMLALAGPIHHASHHRDLHLFYLRVALLPDGHLPAEIALDLISHVLEESAGGSAAAGTGSDLGSEASQLQRLKDLLADDHLFGAIAIGKRRERSANGVANALLQKNTDGGRARDDALRAESGLRQAQMQAVVALFRQHAVDGDQ